jgi:pyruvate, water dikinase
MKFVKWLKELSKKDLPLVGGKAANLGEMYNAGLPVPQAFVVTVEAYKEFLKRTKLKGKILKILKETDFNNPANLEENTKKIRELIENAKMPEEIEKEIIDAYEELSKEFVKEEEYVAVRSSATAEDIVGASFAGLQLTLLNIKGKENVVKAVKKCWASLFTPRATFYRHQKGFKHEKVYIAIPVQKQLGVLSKDEYLQGKYKAGIGFTIHPVTGEKNKIVVEASYGQGEAVVSGEVNPDTYVIDKESGKVLEAHIGTKEKMKITKEGGELEEVEVPENMRKVLCLSEDEIKQLWNLARKLEEHYQFPQDFEWASENGKVYLVQSRPVTVFYEKKEAKIIVEKPPILKGLPASPGVAIGRVKVCLTIEEARQKLEKGDILVTKMTSPDWVPFMRIASGIITTEGGMTCISGNTLLLTDRGFLKAKELYEKIINGETFKILAFDSKANKFVFKRIVAAGKNRKRIIRIQISNKRKNENLDVLDISPDHKFVTFLNGELTKIPLEELLKEELGVLIPEKIDSLEELNFGDKFAYILGLVITDGYINLTKRRGVLVLSQKLEGIRRLVGERYIEYLTSLTGKDIKIYRKPCVTGVFNGRKIAGSPNNFNLTLFGKQFVSNISSFVENLDQVSLHFSENELKHFLGGVLDGDGSFASDSKRLHIYVNPTERKCFEAIMTSLLRLGIHPQVCFNRSIYNLQIIEGTKELIDFTSRFQKLHLKERTKYKSTRYFVAKQVLKDFVAKISYKGRLKVYVERNHLIGEKVIRKIIEEGREKGIDVSKLEQILASPFRQMRVRKIKDLGIDEVYNFEVDSTNELDKNFVVFTNTLTPVVVSNSHAAIVSRELGIPCIVGASNSLEVLKDGMMITLDSRNGLVYEGEIRDLLEREKALEVSLEEVAKLKTRTKILMNLGVPTEIERYKDLPFDGIGLMRIEFIIAEWIKEHPNYMIEKGEEQKYIDKLAEGIAMVAKAIYPRFVVVRFSDFKTNEYRQLVGGEKYEPIEANPMLGWRGVSRYISPQFEKAFRLECKAIRKVREEYKLDNVWVMLPFVRTTWEVEKVLKIMEEEGLKRGETFKVWLMAEVPSIVFLADKFAKYCDGFSIGSNDLTQLVLGIDRDSSILANMGYFDERNEAVLRAIKEIIKKAHKKGVTISICGQAPSVYPEIPEFLVECGIDSISVNGDVVAKTRKLVYEIENKLK